MYKYKTANHPRPWMSDNRSVTCSDLQSILTGSFDDLLSRSSMDEVYPNIYVGDHLAVTNIERLKQTGITHVLNACQGFGNTPPAIYKKAGFKYLGLQAEDSPTYNLMPHFHAAANFIDSAVQSPGGKILVNCKAGVSRSPTLVIAYLMLSKNMHVTDGLKVVRSKRLISPNAGFLAQLCKLQDDIETGDHMPSRQFCCFVLKPKSSYRH